MEEALNDYKNKNNMNAAAKIVTAYTMMKEEVKKIIEKDANWKNKINDNHIVGKFIIEMAELEKKYKDLNYFKNLLKKLGINVSSQINDENNIENDDYDDDDDDDDIDASGTNNITNYQLLSFVPDQNCKDIDNNDNKHNECDENKQVIEDENKLKNRKKRRRRNSKNCDGRKKKNVQFDSIQVNELKTNLNAITSVDQQRYVYIIYIYIYIYI